MRAYRTDLKIIWARYYSIAWKVNNVTLASIPVFNLSNQSAYY